MSATKKPVLLVHGIWDEGRRLTALETALARAGLGPIHALDLVPNDGRASILELAEQARDAARALMSRADSESLDVVGFSMGALVARTFVQRLGGKRWVRRFVSISGPHAGTALAFALPFAGVKQMRPGSELLRELAADPDPWGTVEVHTLYTPFDVMIVPATSSRLAGARSETRLPIPLHRWMIQDARALEHVTRILAA